MSILAQDANHIPDNSLSWLLHSTFHRIHLAATRKPSLRESQRPSCLIWLIPWCIYVVAMTGLCRHSRKRTQDKNGGLRARLPGGRFYARDWELYTAILVSRLSSLNTCGERRAWLTAWPPPSFKEVLFIGCTTGRNGYHITKVRIARIIQIFVSQYILRRSTIIFGGSGFSVEFGLGSCCAYSPSGWDWGYCKDWRGWNLVAYLWMHRG